MQYLIYKHPKGPNIGFRSVDIGEQSFRRHVDGAADVNVLETLIRGLEFLCKPKVGNLSNSVTEEDVRHFKIPVDDLVIAQILQG